MNLFGKKDKKEERKVNIGPGETKELMMEVPIELIEEAKRRGKTKGIIRVKYNDENGEEYEQDFEFDIKTGEIKEIIDINQKEKCHQAM